MSKTRYIINVETPQDLNNEQKLELLADFRTRLMGYSTQAPDFIRGSSITITRELSNEDIMESISREGLPTTPTTNSQTREQCFYYDEAQGKHKCTNDLVKSNHCDGVCKFYWTKKSKP